MFFKIAGFELRYQLRSPMFWVGWLIFGLLTFGAVTSDNVRIGSTANVNVNSPFAILQTLQIMSVLAIFIVAAFVANVVVRDDETGFGRIIHSTRVSRFNYLFGRFTGAFIVGCLAFAAAPLGMLLGSFMPWLDPETVGPLRIMDYVYVYGLICLPTLFVTGAGCFALATITRSAVSTYVGAMTFLTLFIIGSAYFNKPEQEHIVALVEPFGLGAVSLATKYWTATERNSQLPEIVGVLLYNRAIWIGTAFVLLIIAGFSFRSAPRASRKPSVRERVSLVKTEVVASELPAPRADAATGRAQLFALARFDMASVFRSPAFVVLVGLATLNALGGLWFADERYDSLTYPVTRVMIETLNSSFAFMVLIIAIYYAGELVWRDRDRKTHEILDATPAPNWAFVLPKIFALLLVLLATIAASTLAALVVQLLKGYPNFEIEHYLLWYVAPWAIDIALFAVLAIFMQVLSPNKVGGWLAMLLFIVAQYALARVGFENNLYQYGDGPETPLSDMNGQGDFAVFRGWFRGYWAAAAVLLCVLSYSLWRRGSTTSLFIRLRILPHRLGGVAITVAVLAIGTMGTLGYYIHQNTHQLNPYRTQIEDDEWSADFEKTILPFEKTPQPTIVDVMLKVDMFPHEPRVLTEGRYHVENRTGKPLYEVHVLWPRDLQLTRLQIPGTRLKRSLDRFNYHVYAFERPLNPGDSTDIEFSTVLEQRGFRNARNSTRVVDNGTFVNNLELAPILGVDRSGLLSDRVKRRKYGLPADLRLPKLEDESARAFAMLRRDSTWVNSDITVSTVAEQTPIAPGYQIFDKVTNGRRITRFKSDTPILHFFSIQSAAYAVKKDRWRDVDLSVYYHPPHAYNVDRMLAAMKAALQYCSDEFSPYQFRQTRILEFPDYEAFAQSFANTVPYSEGIGFIANTSDPDRIDFVTYVTAHEIAHQWWAHQVLGAQMQGVAFLSETLSQYTALMVMEKLYGPDQIRRFLKFELDHYLRNRGGEPIEELPLERVENQAYIYYRKGSVAMYQLKDTIGEAAVNRALSRLVEQYALKNPPYPTSRDLIRLLRAEAAPEHQQLITDLFQKITLYDVSVTNARKRRLPNGKWETQLEVNARKLYADGEGRETEAPFEEAFDIGAFSIEPGKRNFTHKQVLTFGQQKVKSGTQTLTITTDREPQFAGVDPYNKRVDRNSEDNVQPVVAAETI